LKAEARTNSAAEALAALFEGEAPEDADPQASEDPKTDPPADEYPLAALFQ
jgi:hypothetical protein